MKKLILLASFASLIVSCGQNQKYEAADRNRQTGFRQFRVDENKTAIKVSLAGVVMGVPGDDYESVWSVIQEAQDNGLIDQIFENLRPIEGGIAHCLVSLDDTKRQIVIDNLKRASTSTNDSYYSIESVSSCDEPLESQGIDLGSFGY